MPSYTTRPTTTTTEIDQALAGVSADVTAANLSELTGGGETNLHSHAATGMSFYTSAVGGIANGVITELPFPTPLAAFDAGLDWQDTGWMITTENPTGGLTIPTTGRYLLFAQGYISSNTSSAEHQVRFDLYMWSAPVTFAASFVVNPADSAVASHPHEFSRALELSAGDQLLLQARHTGDGTLTTQVHLQLQYLGPATGLS